MGMHSPSNFFTLRASNDDSSVDRGDNCIYALVELKKWQPNLCILEESEKYKPFLIVLSLDCLLTVHYQYWHPPQQDLCIQSKYWQCQVTCVHNLLNVHTPIN